MEWNCTYVLFFVCSQAASKKVITREEWEKKLNDVKIRKEDMNKLVMNFLVTEGYVDVAEKFKTESGTARILSLLRARAHTHTHIYIYVLFYLISVLSNTVHFQFLLLLINKQLR